MRVLTCLAFEHHLPSVLLAGLVCVISCLLSMRLLRRSEESDSVVQVAWLVVTATCLSAGIWSTHFIALLAIGLPQRSACKWMKPRFRR